MCEARVPERLIAERYARRMGLFLGDLSVQEHKWWSHISACMRMPRGGVHGTGSQECQFEFSIPGAAVLRTVVEALPLKQRQVWEQGDWVPSKTIDTYYALDVKAVDDYLKLHRRKCLLHLGGFYRSSRVIAPQGKRAPGRVLLSVLPPLLLEVCHRTGKRIEVVASFKLLVLNDLNAITLPPQFAYATGMDVVFKQRALNHLQAMHARGASMSDAFAALAELRPPLQDSDSEASWEDTDLESVEHSPVARRRSRHSSPSSHDAGSDSDSASDAAREERLNARGEAPRTPHHQAFPRSAHRQST